MNQVQCPNCKSYKTHDQVSIYRWGGIFGFFVGFPLIPFIIGIPLIIAGPLMFLASFGMKKDQRMKCDHCQFQFPKP